MKQIVLIFVLFVTCIGTKIQEQTFYKSPDGSGNTSSPMHGTNTEPDGVFITMETEIWKDVPGYEGKYQASTLGRVRSLDRETPFKNSVTHRKGKVLKHGSVGGYLNINLFDHALKCKSFLAHRVIAITFIPNDHSLKEVNHKDGDKKNNRVENLEWCTRSENIMHGYRTGLYGEHGKGENNKVSKLTNSDIYKIRAIGHSQPYVKTAAEFGVANVVISRIVRRLAWAHIE